MQPQMAKVTQVVKRFCSIARAKSMWCYTDYLAASVHGIRIATSIHEFVHCSLQRHAWHVNKCLYTYMYTDPSISILISIHAYLCMYMYIYMYRYVHIYINM